MPVCIRCTVADNAVKLIGQHTYSHQQASGRDDGHLDVVFAPQKEDVSLDRHYTAHCVTQLANKIQEACSHPSCIFHVV